MTRSKETLRFPKVWLVGAGPGDPGLLTLRGRQVLEAADVVVGDRLVSAGILALIPAGADLIEAGKAGYRHGTEQGEIHEILIREALRGKRVVRLKGGDPYLFGRGGEEALALTEQGIAVEVVPGVSSALAVPALAGIPVTHRGHSGALHIITWIRGVHSGGKTGDGKHREPSDEELSALAAAGGTLVILMGGRAIRSIGTRLIAAGYDPDTAAAVIASGSLPRQKVMDFRLSELCGISGLCSRAAGDAGDAGNAENAENADGPAVVVVGAVCRTLRHAAAAGSDFPPAAAAALRGLRILAARPAGQFAKTAAAIEEHGGEAISFPCIQTAKLDLPPETFAHITGYDWLVFVSPSGVRYFFEGLFAAGGDARTVGPRKVAAIGPATAKALEAYGIRADLVPKKSDSGGLGRALAAAAAGARVLIPRSAKGSSELHDILRAKGIDAAEIGIYDTIPAAVSPYVLALAESGSFDAVFFACPSSVRAFVSLLPNTEPKGVLAVCIGAATGRAAEGCGMKTILAEETSAAGMVRALAEYRRGEEVRERRLL